MKAQLFEVRIFYKFYIILSVKKERVKKYFIVRFIKNIIKTSFFKYLFRVQDLFTVILASYRILQFYDPISIFSHELIISINVLVDKLIKIASM